MKEMRSKAIIDKYQLREHVEGGFFAEVYTAPTEKDGRHLMGSAVILKWKGK